MNPEARSPELVSRGEWILLALLVILFAGCQSPSPTSTVVPFPTATHIATETAEPAVIEQTPTLTPVRAVVTDTLRVREQPDLNARILTRLPKDTNVLLWARKDDNQWYAIEWPPGSGEPGWVSADYVVPEGPTDQLIVGFTSPPPPPGSIYALTNFLIRYRSGPGTVYDWFGRIPANSRVTLLARSPDGQWFQIFDPRDPNKRVWIALKAGEDTLLNLQGAGDSLGVAAAPPTPTPMPTAIPRPTRTPGAFGVALNARILMSSNRSGSYGIYPLAEDGGVGKVLTAGGESYGARWSPDGGRIVFHRTVAGAAFSTSHIYVMNADGSGVRLVSASGNASDTDPDWSPNGKQVVFVRTPRAGAPEIWIANADSSGAHRLVTLSAATGIGAAEANDFSPQPRWSPDGGRIVYSAVPRTSNPSAPLYPNIFMIRADGSGETQLTDNDFLNANPIWSPDGKQIAWSAKDLFSHGNWDIWAMSASGGNQRMLIGSVSGDGNSGVQAVEWVAGDRMLLAGWAGSWNVFIANLANMKVTPVTKEVSDNRPTDWQP